MALFGGAKSKSYLGIDVGVGGMKLVELANEKGRAKLMTYAYTERALPDQGKSLLDDAKATGVLIAKMVKQSGGDAVKAVSGLPQHMVFDSVISVPAIKDPKQLKPLVEAQIRKLAPIPIEEMIIDSRVIENKEKQEHVRVLVTGAAKTLVSKYVEAFKTAKVELISLETESFALIRSLIGRDKAVIMILDIGAMRTNITIVEKGVPFFTRSVNVGGGQLTKTIAEQMGISLEEAEQMKLDLGKGPDEGVPPSVERLLQPILNEINYSIGEFRRQENRADARLEKIIITGGSAQLPGMVQYLSGKLNTNVYIGDPWARVAVPEALRPVLDEIGPRFAVAIGLAMRDIE
ncbi:MAG: type IV pilus assembly protein PilM [Patescibacteria group bacterium]